MSYWKQSRNPQVKLANSQDFLSDESISQNCRTSYNDYILNTQGEELPMKGDFYQTDWTYVDNEAKPPCQYKATYNGDFGWGVMKMPAPEPKKQQQQQSTTTLTKTSTQTPENTTTATIPTTIELRLSPKAEENLGQIAEAAQMIATILAGKDIKTAKDMLQK